MCPRNQTYQYINPSTQVALLSHCVDNCIVPSSIHWRIYKSRNNSLNFVDWDQLTDMNSSQDYQLFGNSIFYKK